MYRSRFSPVEDAFGVVTGEHRESVTNSAHAAPRGKSKRQKSNFFYDDYKHLRRNANQMSRRIRVMRVHAAKRRFKNKPR